MKQIPYSQLVKGTFLIASPDLQLGVYERAVILLCEHSQEGSFGLVINKPLDIELPEEILNLKELANPHIQVCVGGPMQPNQMMLLHSLAGQSEEHTLEICEGVYLGGDLPFLQEATSSANGPRVRLCFGYIAWGPGQLEREFLNGQWFLCAASAKHVFDTPSEKVWQTVLREMGGKYATLSMMPEDLSLN